MSSQFRGLLKLYLFFRNDAQLESNISHSLMIQSLAKGKVFQSFHMSHNTRRLFEPSKEIHARILKFRSYKIVFFPILFLCFQSDCRTHFNNPRLLLVNMDLNVKLFLFFKMEAEQARLQADLQRQADNFNLILSRRDREHQEEDNLATMLRSDVERLASER